VKIAAFIENWPDWRLRRKAVSVLITLALAVVAVLGALIAISFALSLAHMSLLVTLYASERWAAFAANLIVIFYTFPAFMRTRNRGFLYLAFAGIIFMYGILFTLLFPMRGTHWSLAQRELYYGSKYIVYIVGLGLYARGVMLLAGTKAPRLHNPTI
jgi:hypothetical protein